MEVLNKFNNSKLPLMDQRIIRLMLMIAVHHAYIPQQDVCVKKLLVFCERT